MGESLWTGAGLGAAYIIWQVVKLFMSKIPNSADNKGTNDVSDGIKDIKSTLNDVQHKVDQSNFVNEEVIRTQENITKVLTDLTIQISIIANTMSKVKSVNMDS
jgi:hypothetical protein